MVAAWRRVGTFSILALGDRVLGKQGGNVASYVVTPDGEVVAAIPGPVDARRYLDELRWAVESYRAGPAACAGNAARLRLAMAARSGVRAMEAPRMERECLRIAVDATAITRRWLEEAPLPALDDFAPRVWTQILGQEWLPSGDEWEPTRLEVDEIRRCR